MSDAEIGVDNLLVRLDRVGNAIGDLAAIIQHHERSERSITTPMSCSMSAMVAPRPTVGLDDEAAHVLLLLAVHARHRLVEQQELRLHRQRPAELDALLQAVGQRADRRLADRLDLEEVDDLLADARDA